MTLSLNASKNALQPSLDAAPLTCFLTALEEMGNGRRWKSLHRRHPDPPLAAVAVEKRLWMGSGADGADGVQQHQPKRLVHFHRELAVSTRFGR